MLNTAERFWRKVQKSAGCWLWTGPKMGKGYGNFARLYLNNTVKRVGAHRFSWELHNGPIPGGLCVLHRCDTPACVNPEHLFLGTIADNNRDMCAKGRDRNNKKTHCPRGHEYTAENTMPIQGRWRWCRQCERDRSRQRYLQEHPNARKNRSRRATA